MNTDAFYNEETDEQKCYSRALAMTEAYHIGPPWMDGDK